MRGSVIGFRSGARWSRNPGIGRLAGFPRNELRRLRLSLVSVSGRHQVEAGTRRKMREKIEAHGETCRLSEVVRWDPPLAAVLYSMAQPGLAAEAAASLGFDRAGQG